MLDNMVGEFPEDKLLDMLNTFEGTRGGNKAGVVTKDEWNRICRETAMATPMDEYFVAGGTRHWNVTEAPEATVDCP